MDEIEDLVEDSENSDTEELENEETDSKVGSGDEASNTSEVDKNEEAESENGSGEENSGEVDESEDGSETDDEHLNVKEGNYYIDIPNWKNTPQGRFIVNAQKQLSRPLIM